MAAFCRKPALTLRAKQPVDRFVEIPAIDKQPHRIAPVEPEARTVPVGECPPRRVLKQAKAHDRGAPRQAQVGRGVEREMRPDPFDPRRDNVAITMVRPTVQRVTEPQRDRLARRQHQPVASEMPKREVFDVQMLEHRRHLRTLQQRDRDQVMALEPGLRRRRALPTPPLHQLSRPNSTTTVDR